MRRALVTVEMSGLGAATAARLEADDIEVVRAGLTSDADVVADVSDPASVATFADRESDPSIS